MVNLENNDLYTIKIFQSVKFLYENVMC